jgi:adenosylmethionine-8-amino-7-oxononanoate aminotransferase
MSKNLAPKNHVFYRNQNWHYPKIEYGKGIYLYGEDGKKYLDGCSGSSVANIGHGNEEVAECAAKQIRKVAFTHLSRFTTDAVEECSRKVAALTPGDLNYVYFMSGGSEAVEAAWKLSRQYFVERDKRTSKWRVVSRWPSFHGNTLGALSMTGITGRRQIYDPFIADFPKINQAYCYRCPYNSEYPKCGLACAHELEMLIKKQGPDNVMAFIAESVIGSAIPAARPPKEYFKIVREICDRHDVLLIVDEVMMGFGRTGKNFGIDHYDIVPDIITIAKGMSCGYSPLGAAVVTDKIFNTIMTEGSGYFIHGHTYGGNPLSAEIANCVLDITEREGYFQNAAVLGEYLAKKMQDLYQYDIVGDVRAIGLMFGIEFVADKKTKEPFDPKKAVKSVVTNACLEQGLVVYPGGGSVDGLRGDHILLAPPISITKEEVDELYSMLEAGIKKACEEIRK